MIAKIIHSSSWIIKSILELKEVGKHHQQTWDSMLSQTKFKMSAMYDVMTHSNNCMEWRHVLMRSAARPRAKFIT